MILEDDYVETLKKEAISKDYNKYRMYNEPSPFFDALFADLEIWEKEGSFDVFVRNFNSKTRWRAEQLLVSQVSLWYINGNPIAFQWRLANGKDLEFVAKRVKQENLREAA